MEGDLELVCALMERAVTANNVAELRGIVFEHLHAHFDFPLAVFSHQDAARVHIVPSREDTEEDLRVRFAEVFEEQARFVRTPPSTDLIVASRDLPASVLQEMATTQIIWQRHGIKETVACAFENANGHFGNLAVTLADARPAQVERLAQYLLRVRSFLSRTLDNLLNCELLTRQSAFLGELADRAAGAIFVSAKGEVTWISPRARALLGERTGSEEVPEQILRTCRLMHHAYAERLPALLRLGESERIALGGRLFVLRYRIMQVQGSTEVLVTIDDTTETSRGRARGLGLTSRELDVAALLVRGMANRQIAGILGISPNTVRNHASKVYERAGVAGRTELTRVLLE